MIQSYMPHFKLPLSPATDRADSLTTAIHIPRSTWKLLRKVAFMRAEKNGGRPSVSSLITSLVEENRRKMEKEITKDLTDESLRAPGKRARGLP